MELILESNNIRDYLEENKWIDYTNNNIVLKAKELFSNCKNDIDKIKVAFEYVRDDISHSWDIKSTRVTKVASEVLEYKEGMCYAKSMLLAALLRPEGIPTGLCYQKLTLGDTPDTGYCLHGLNAIYIDKLDKWIRVDARGNTNGKNAQFYLDKEKLAFDIRERYFEIDYPTIYVTPIRVIVETLNNNNNCIEMIKYNLPIEIES